MTIHRRRFIQHVAAGAVAAHIAPSLLYATPLPTPRAAASRVVRTKRARLVDTNEKLHPGVVRTTIEEALMALADAGSARARGATDQFRIATTTATTTGWMP